MSTISERIKALRKALKLNQTDFAKSLGLTMQGVQLWEYGKSGIKETSIRLIESTFNVNPSWLRDGVGEMFLDKSNENTTLTSKDKFIINALESGIVSEEEKDFILKYIEERVKLAEHAKSITKHKKTS